MTLEAPVRLLRIIGLLSILVGFTLMVLGLLGGELQLALFIIFPVIYGQGLLGVGGILLIFLGFVLLFFSLAARSMPRERDIERDWDSERDREIRTRGEFGGVVFIGPIPIVFGSGKELLKNHWFLAAIIVIAVIMLILTLSVVLL